MLRRALLISLMVSCPCVRAYTTMRRLYGALNTLPDALPENVLLDSMSLLYCA